MLRPPAGLRKRILKSSLPHLGSPRPSHGLGNQQSIVSKTSWKNHSLRQRSIKYSVWAKSGHYFCKVLLKHTHTHVTGQWDFPDGTGDKNLPTSAGDTGLIPSRKIPHTMGQQSSGTTTMERDPGACALLQEKPTKEACILQLEKSLHLQQLEKAYT